MQERWRELFAKWAEQEEFKAKVAEARRIIEKALCKDKCYVAFSGGKDSTALVHLVCQQEPDILVYHHSQGAYMPDWAQREIEEIARTAGARNLKIYPADRDFWTDILQELQKAGYAGVFVGLRKEEGVKRKLRIESKDYLTLLREYWPLAAWSWMDVWAYIVSRGLKYHSAYDRYAELLGWDRARFHAFFDPRLDRFGQRNVDSFFFWKDRWK